GEPCINILHGKPIQRAGMQHAFRKHADRCGVSHNVTPHDLRRTAATILYAATKDLRVPQQLLGHKDLSSTLSYLAPLAPDEARRYAQLLRFDKFHPKEGEKPQ
ncbi:MAG: tyrosine-type recombinase/integrase, partial [Candidatus Acidiferrum sp.]